MTFSMYLILCSTEIKNLKGQTVKTHINLHICAVAIYKILRTYAKQYKYAQKASKM